MTVKQIRSQEKLYKVFEFEEIKDDTIYEVSKLYTREHIDSLIILKNKKPYYIITSSDIIDALIAHDDNMPLSQFIEKTPKSLISVTENETVFEAYKIIRSFRLHHLVIVDENGYFLRVLTFYDFANFLTEIALKDDMTGLYNKRFFDFIMDKYKDTDEAIGFIFIDLNNFKMLNDKYGHLFGDQVLKEVASVIRSSIREIDYAFRFGGDEFVIMLFTQKDIVCKVAKRIYDKLIKIKVENEYINAGIGVAHYPSDSNSLEIALDLADKRMYEAKKSGEVIC